MMIDCPNCGKITKDDVQIRAGLSLTVITPEQWIKHFYDVLEFDDRFDIVDNTNMTPRETAEYIEKI